MKRARLAKMNTLLRYQMISLIMSSRFKGSTRKPSLFTVLGYLPSLPVRYRSMVSTRPSPSPAKGRIAYPTATSYVPGDSENSPIYVDSPELNRQTTTTLRDFDRDGTQGLKTWWKTFRERTETSEREGSLEIESNKADFKGIKVYLV